MFSAFRKASFRKTSRCPSSQFLLTYHRDRVTKRTREIIEIHLGWCDFCRAELQLLMQHRAKQESYHFVEIPANLRKLVEELLSAKPLRFARDGSA